MDKCAIYCRVSSEKQEQDGTIQSQLAKVRDYAKTHSYEIVQEYLDDGYSGDLLTRPALDRLRNDAESGNFSRLIVLSPDRLARRYIYIELVRDELRKRGVETEYLNQKNDNSDEGRLLSGVTGLFAEYEKAKFLERCRRGRLHRAQMGLMVTSRAPYGYDYIPKAQGFSDRLKVNEEQAKIVRTIFSLCVNSRLSVSGIVRELHNKGVHPPQRWRPSTTWAKSTIKKILKNETYAGVWHYGKYYSAEPMKPTIGKVYRSLRTSRRLTNKSTWLPISAPAIIDRSTYDLAQEQIRKNTVFSPRNTKHLYLLGGLCRCGDCGHSYQGIPSHERFYYRCNGPRNNRLIPRTCFNPSHSAPKLENEVWRALSRALRNPAILHKNLDGIRGRISKGKQNIQYEERAIQSDKARLAQAEERLLGAFSEGLIDADQLRSQMEKIREKKNQLNGRATVLAREAPNHMDFEDADGYRRALAKGLDRVEASPDRKRQLLKMLIRTITIRRTEVVISGAIPAQSTPQTLSNVEAPITGHYGRYTAIPFELATRI